MENTSHDRLRILCGKAHVMGSLIFRPKSHISQGSLHLFTEPLSPSSTSRSCPFQHTLLRRPKILKVLLSRHHLHHRMTPFSWNLHRHPQTMNTRWTRMTTLYAFFLEYLFSTLNQAPRSLKHVLAATISRMAFPFPMSGFRVFISSKRRPGLSLRVTKTSTSWRWSFWEISARRYAMRCGLEGG